MAEGLNMAEELMSRKSASVPPVAPGHRLVCGIAKDEVAGEGPRRSRSGF